MFSKIITQFIDGEKPGIAVSFEYRCDFCGSCATFYGPDEKWTPRGPPHRWVTKGKNSYCIKKCMLQDDVMTERPHGEHFVLKHPVVDWGPEPVWHCALDRGTALPSHLPGLYIDPDGLLNAEDDGSTPVEWVKKLIEAYEKDKT